MLAKSFAALFLIAGGAGSLNASQVYSCGGGSACDGNLYAIWIVSQTATSYVLDIGIQVTDNYIGDRVDYINGLAIVPDNQHSSTVASLVSSPTNPYNPNVTWTLQSGGQNSTGCSSSVAPSICAGATGLGAPLFANTGAARTLVWQFLITGTPPSLGDTAHISYHYINTGMSSTGSTGSFNVPIQCTGGQGCDDQLELAPVLAAEPVTSALVGTGLIGLYFIRRRRPRSR